MEISRYGSASSVGEGGFHLRTRVQCSQHFDRADRRPCEFGGDVIGYAGETQHVDLERLPGSADLLQVVARKVPQAKIQRLARHRTPGRVGMALELVADRSSDEVGSIGVELFRHQKVDVAQVDVSQV